MFQLVRHYGTVGAMEPIHPIADLGRLLVILGAGYTGRHIYAQAARAGIPIGATSRTLDNRLPTIPASDRLEFDLHEPTTWSHIPPGADIIWCFPAEPIELVRAFADHSLVQAHRLVVLGSTSAYDLRTGEETTAPILDESAPIDAERPRVRGEEYLRCRHGAIIVRAAGIYGPGRNVLDWIRQGRVGPSARYVNLVHVEDLAAICLLALEKGQPGDIYNVSDGHPRRWVEICAEAGRRWGVQSDTTAGDRRAGRRISNAKVCHSFGYTFRHPDLFAALEAIESAT